MFDAIGRKGRTKPLSPYRWVVSSVVGLGLIGLSGVMFDVIQNAPAAEPETKEEDVEVTFVQKAPPPPPPPPPPAAPPKSTTRPLKNQLSKQVVKQEIKEPEPTPPPPKDAPTPEPEPEAAVADAGGVPGGVPGGVLGGVLGGVVGGTVGAAPSDIKEVNFEEIVIERRVPPVYPALAKRNRITGSVMVMVYCNADGSVSRIEWLSGNEIFKDAVFAAVRQMKYGANPFPFSFRQPFNFTLKGG